jgi:RimK family alpha-L-glutamate ligase
MVTPEIIIFNDTHGWHSQQLCEALQKLGAKPILSSLEECTIDLESPTGLNIAGMSAHLPSAVIVRGIAPGSFEQITLRMDVLHTLSELNIPVFNSAKAIEHTVDKARTSLRLHLAGINTPLSWVSENNIKARTLIAEQLAQGHQLVSKPLFGCQGKGLEKISSLEQFDALSPVGGVFYLQRYVEPVQPSQWQDWRLMVIQDRVCAAMSRRSNHWITNFAQGAECFATTINAEMEQLAIDSTRAVGADYAGVDIIRTQDGQYTVLEVNSVPAWKGLYHATGIDVAESIATAVIERIQQTDHFSENAGY